MLLGSQSPRFNTAPSPRGYTITDATDALALVDALEYVPDEWQADAVRSWLRRGPDDLWCASTWGLTVPRQNGKNGTLEIVEIYLTVMLGLKILHTAHHLGTARKAFKRLRHFFGEQVNDPNAKFPALNKLVVEIRKTNGQEAIVLANGGCIEVGARTGGAGRGSSFDVLVVDEAQEYEPDEQEALEATVSASPSGDPVIIYMGTPPAVISERGEPFVRVRDAAVTGEDDRCAWVEHSARGDVDKMTEAELRVFVRDRKNWAEANPALGGRIKERTVEGESKRFAPRSFARERLNMWPTPKASQRAAVDIAKWNKLALGEGVEPDPEWPLAAFGVDMNPERTQVTICAATFADDWVHLELAADTAFSRDGTTALVEWLWSHAGRRTPVVLDAYSPARDILEVPLRKRGMTENLYILDGKEFTQACALTRQAIEVDRSVSHYSQEQLDTSIEHAAAEPLKNFPGAFRWVRQSLDVPLAPFMAATYAYFGAIKFARRRRSRSARKPRGAVVF
ncbi:hypothetical protein [Galactobacter caseinivorans]|uniref:hypothetical protein n=1 Tax=Galactobacter caseinivorans TaxID=2676123 RepID=UPI000EB1F779|nr:hypothetical protein [Galactobacter caseinivorans]